MKIPASISAQREEILRRHVPFPPVRPAPLDLEIQREESAARCRARPFLFPMKYIRMKGHEESERQISGQQARRRGSSKKCVHKVRARRSLWNLAEIRRQISKYRGKWGGRDGRSRRGRSGKGQLPGDEISFRDDRSLSRDLDGRGAGPRFASRDAVAKAWSCRRVNAGIKNHSSRADTGRMF